MAVINKLPKEISDLIAAGEVVERPASVVKELVENSIDAHATMISVEIKNGGAALMRITDNGSGMSREDAENCFLRHATSKIKTAQDLDRIQTLGFRGEALSSIGAVSRITMFTKTVADEVGTQISFVGGELVEVDEVGCPEGTSFIVENLFFNTPARLKFLKKDQTEAAYIQDIMTRFVLAHPEISFKLIKDGREQFFTPGDGVLKNAVYSVYGKEYARSTIEVCHADSGIEVGGLIGKSDTARANRNYQSVFVNGRYVRSPLVVRAIEDAYKNQIMIGKYPMAILNITINPELIDINVHPTKLEIKFSDEQAVYRAVFHGVRNALYEIPHIPRIERVTEESDSKPLTANSYVRRTPEEIRRELGDSKQEKTPVQQAASGSSYTAKPLATAPEKEIKQILVSDITNSVKPVEVEEKRKDYEFPNEIPKRAESLKATEEKPPVFEAPEPAKQIVIEPLRPEKEPDGEEKEITFEGDWRIVGQVFKSYIIVERAKEIFFVDQHAAHERLKYEELLSELETGIPSQMLMIPETVELLPIEARLFAQYSEVFDSMGFEIESFGENTLLVRAIPEIIEIDEIKQLILELLPQLESGNKAPVTKRRERMLYTIACKAAVKANRAMSDKECESLVRDVLALENINTCPHGRPIVVTMTQKELEKEFKRII